MRKFIVVNLFVLFVCGYSFAETLKLGAAFDVFKCPVSFGEVDCAMSIVVPGDIEVNLTKKGEHLWSGHWKQVVEKESVKFLGVVHVEKHRFHDFEGKPFFRYKVGGVAMDITDETPENYVPPVQVSTWVSNVNDLNTIHLNGDIVFVNTVPGDAFELRPLLLFGASMSLGPIPELPSK